MFGVDLPARAIVAVSILPLPGLESAVHDDHLAFEEILSNELAALTPCNTVDEVRLALLALCGVVALHGHGEQCHRRPGLRITQFGIAGEAAHDHDVVKHQIRPPSMAGPTP